MKNLFSLILCLSVLASFAQGEFVVELNRLDSSFTKTGPKIGDITYIYPGDRAYNETTGTFMFPSALPDRRLYAINTANGAIVDSPLISNPLPLSHFHFANTTQKLYGLAQDNPNGVRYFVSINPSTGAYDTLGMPIPGSGLYAATFSAFDQKNHLFYFRSPSSSPPSDLLYTINALDGSVVSSPFLSLAPDEALIHFSFESSSGRLYGLLRDNTLQRFFLVRIDPATGLLQRIGNGTIHASGNGNATIDTLHQEYIFMYSSADEGGYFITTLDIATGNLISNVFMLPLGIIDNLHSIVFDHVKRKLYSIHWENMSATAVESAFAYLPTTLSPNPAREALTLSFPNPHHLPFQLLVYDGLGKTWANYEGVREEAIVIERKSLPSGVYFFQLLFEGQVRADGKFMFMD